MAKLTMQEATDKALTQVPGQILKAELEDENGYLVYGVEVIRPDGTVTEVKIDAGTGGVLQVDADHADGEREDDEEDVHHED